MADEKEPTDWSAPHKPKRWPVIVGAVFTAAWLGYLLYYRLNSGTEFGALEPNEFGDFLAGAFAPLAFLWLVLGFWQQGQELRHSSDALRLQGQELQHSVSQQREHVEVVREQLKFERELMEHEREEVRRRSQPILTLHAGGSIPSDNHTRLYSFHLYNHGRVCTDVRIEMSNYGGAVTTPSIPTGNVFDFRMMLPHSGGSEHVMTITFRDELLNPGVKCFDIKKSFADFQITEIVAD